VTPNTQRHHQPVGGGAALAGRRSHRPAHPSSGRPDVQWFTVVGVVADVKQDDWRDAGEAVVYFPLTGPTPTAWALGSPAYVVKSPRAASLGREVRELVRQVAPEAPVYREYTMEFLAERSMVQLSFTTLTLGVISALAIVLGALGLYGVLSYVVAERTREIGVRMALGATARSVRLLVMSQGAKVVVVGVVLGIAVALASTHLLEALLFEVSAVDPLVFVAMSLMMVGIGMAGELHAGAARKPGRSDRVAAQRLAAYDSRTSLLKIMNIRAMSRAATYDENSAAP
jgi:hypothetical protein